MAVSDNWRIAAALVLLSFAGLVSTLTYSTLRQRESIPPLGDAPEKSGDRRGSPAQPAHSESAPSPAAEPRRLPNPPSMDPGLDGRAITKLGGLRKFSVLRGKGDAQLTKLQERLFPPQSGVDWADGIPVSIRNAAEAAIISGLTLAALFLRIGYIDDLSPGIHTDEINNLWLTERILAEGWVGVWSPENSGIGALTHYIASPFILIGGNSIEILRAAVATLGALIIPAGYFLVRQLFGARLALMTAALLTFNVWFVIQSRIGWDALMPSLIYIAAMALLVAAIKRGNIWIAILAGLVFALGSYSNKIYLVFLVATLPIIAGSMLFHKQTRGKLELRWFLGVAFLASLERLLFYFRDFDLMGSLDGYGASTSLSWESVSGWLHQAWRLFLSVHNPIHPGAEGAGGIPLLNIFEAVFFWIGLAIVLLFINRRPYQLLLLGWLVAMAPAVLVPEGEARRYLLGVFFLLLIMSIGVVAVAQSGIRLLISQIKLPESINTDWILRGSALLIVALFLLSSAISNRSDYNGWANGGPARWHFNYDLIHAGRYLEKVDADTAEHYATRMYSTRWAPDWEIIRFAIGERPVTRGDSEHGGDGSIHSGGPVERDTVFLLLDGYISLAPELQEAYPQGTLHTQRDEDGRIMYVAYLIRAEDLPSGSTNGEVNQ